MTTTSVRPKKKKKNLLPQEDDEMDLYEWLCDDYWKKMNGKSIIIRANLK